jgi:hypothetical protein
MLGFNGRTTPLVRYFILSNDRKSNSGKEVARKKNAVTEIDTTNLRRVLRLAWGPIYFSIFIPRFLLPQ